MNRAKIFSNTGSNGSVIFKVYARDAAGETKIYDSGVMYGSSSTKKISLSVAGKTRLRLVVVQYNNKDYDHADWANAILIK